LRAFSYDLVRSPFFFTYDLIVLYNIKKIGGLYMKIAVNKKELWHALSFVQKTVATRSTLPVLTNIFLKAENGKILLFSTNQECSTSIDIPAEIGEAGDITVPAKIFLDISKAISSIKDEEVFLSSEDGHTVQVKAGSYNYLLNGIEGSKYLEFIPDFKPVTQFDVSGSDLHQMLGMARLAVSQDESKPELMGAQTEIKGKMFRMAATDSRRLVVVNKTLPEEIEGEHYFLIPGRALNDINSFISEDEPVRILLNDNGNMVCFEVRNMKFYARLLDGKFPDYEGVIPENMGIDVKINVDSLRESLEAVMPIARESANIVKLNFSGSTLILESVSSENGLAKIEMFCEKHGDDFEINFNARFLLDALNSIQDEKIIMSFKSALAPCVLKSEIHPDDFLWVIMPIRSA